MCYPIQKSDTTVLGMALFVSVFAEHEQFSGASSVAGWGADLVNLHPPPHFLTHTNRTHKWLVIMSFPPSLGIVIHSSYRPS